MMATRIASQLVRPRALDPLARARPLGLTNVGLRPTAAAQSAPRLQLQQQQQLLRLYARRFVSTEGAAPPRPGFLRRHPAVRWVLFGAGSVVFGLTITLGCLLGYDAMTYHEAHIGKVPASPLALHPQTGGPKNLPIVSDYIEGEQDDTQVELERKERLVIVGGGWGAVALMSQLDPKKYNVTVVAPNNFYLFTPLLPSATVGTVEPRSLVEPLRKIIARLHGHYVQGTAVDVVMGDALPPAAGGAPRYLEVKVIDGHSDATGKEGASSGKSVYVPYDRLVIAVGSATNTHGVPGLENCFQLKTVQDARAIRSHIMDNLEMAALPTTSPEDREKLLSFVICGGGPTGVETASELYDMLNEDVLDYFPKLLRASAKVHLIQSREHILNTYSEKISNYAEKKFARDEVDIITNARVKRVDPDKVVYTTKGADGSFQEHEIPSGFVLWSTGIAMSPFTRRVTQILPNQAHLKAIEVDSHLRVKGAPLGSMYAIGDASTIETRLIDHLYDFVDACDINHDGKLDFEEFKLLVKSVGKKFPLATKHFEKVRELFDTYKIDKDGGSLGLNEIAKMFLETQNKMTTLPATAQTAAQQGKYLGKKLNKLAKKRDSGADMSPHSAEEVFDVDDVLYKPFQYHNLGSLAYIGNAAAFDIPFLPEAVGQFAGGLVAMYMWRSFYLSESASIRTRLLLLNDWIRRGLFGRDISRI